MNDRTAAKNPNIARARAFAAFGHSLGQILSFEADGILSEAAIRDAGRRGRGLRTDLAAFYDQPLRGPRADERNSGWSLLQLKGA